MFVFLISCIIAQSVLSLFYIIHPVHFNPQTDIVGFPLFANFNIDQQLRIFFEQMILFPVLSFIIYFTFNFKKFSEQKTPPDNENYSRAPRSQYPLLCKSLKIVLPFAAFLPYWASERTGVRIELQNFHSYPWFPFSLSILLYLIGLVLSLRSLKILILYFVAPILIYLTQAQLAVPRDWFHLFHEGETLVPAKLLMEGFFPWKDFLFMHGLMQDPLMSWVGFKLFEPTVWGADSGVSLILAPFFRVTLYFMWLVFFREKTALIILLSFVLPEITPLFFNHFHIRFLFMPLCLLSIYCSFKNLNKKTLALTTLALSVQCILIPEHLLILSLYPILLFLFAWNKIGIKKSRNLIFTFAIIAIPSLATWFYFLHLNQALHPFIKTYSEFGFGYHYGTGIPIQWNLGIEFKIGFIISIFAHLLAVIYLASRVLKKDLSPKLLLVICIDFLLLIYFQHFLSRADEHVWVASSIAVILILVLLSLIIESTEKKLPSKFKKIKFSYWLLIFICFYHYPKLKNKISKLNSQYSLVVPPIPKWKAFGYRRMNPLADEIITDFDTFLSQHLSTQEKLFDFTNETGLFHFILDYKPASRYLNPNIASSSNAQHSLIKELEISKPKLVIFSSQLEYSSIDGVPASVRRHHVSRYLLKNYKPIKVFKHHVVLERNDQHLKQTTNLKASDEIPLTQAYDREPCHFGYIPYHWKWRENEPNNNSTNYHSIPFLTKETPSGYFTEIMIPTQKNTIDSILIEFKELVKDFFSIYPNIKVPSNNRIHFNTLPDKNVRYEIPVSSCIQWHNPMASSFYLHHLKNQNIYKISLGTLKSE